MEVWRLITTALRVLTTPKLEIFAEVEARGCAGERIAAHEVGAQLRELPFVDVGIFNVELVRDDDTEGSVAEEFEAFIGADANAWIFVEVRGVDQRLPQQVRILEGN